MNRTRLSRLLINRSLKGQPLVHILGAIFCLAIAAILSSVLISEHQALPGWVALLCAVAILVLVVNAFRVYRNGRERIRRNEGPRTRIVLSDSSSSNPPIKASSPSDE